MRLAKSAGSLSLVQSASQVWSSGERVAGLGGMEAQMIILLGGVCGGAFLHVMNMPTVGMLSIYFGAQTGLGLYMKILLSDLPIAPELNVRGVPAPFLVTALQQLLTFVALSVVLLALLPTRWAYVPRPIQTGKEAGCVLIISLAFAANIGLNNLSLSLLPVSANMIIRSCIPLITWILQQLLGCFGLGGFPSSWGLSEFALLLSGLVCAIVSLLAQKSNTAISDGGGLEFILGVGICLLSDVAAAVNVLVVSYFGKSLEPPLNSFDTVLYMALPCTFFMLFVSLFASHPVEWAGFPQLTDLQVLKHVLSWNATALVWVILSGFLAAGYNCMSYSIVQRLSATTAGFAGNFNKAALILISICLGLERLPPGIWAVVMVAAVVGNILSFTGFSLLEQRGAPQAKSKS
ncbi:unnamed protein product [Symbiodinium pilosum]|uniref:Sugar phosphate transporter domain-containing protein n=1 Tax=Symbiodinium pilosum TaxID=2952 RepID=A0A812MQ41_SYMPI|nr:unnamed protein product [Symbiodinium pilosum]